MVRIPSAAWLLLGLTPVALAADSATPLHEGWKLASACKVSAAGDAISAPGFHTADWLTISVPATVLAGQVAAGVYPDPYFGMNLRNVPGETYPIGHNFANLAMPADSPYHCGWWYRREVPLPAADKGKRLWLHFGGINYRADVWFNGTKIADQTQVAGAYRTYDFDVTQLAKPGTPNYLAVETFAPGEKDLGINWVDWNPAPPDKDMGLWGDVTLGDTGPVTLRSPMAATHFTDASLYEADLTVYAELQNATDHPVSGKLEGTVAGVAVEQPITLEAHQDLSAAFTPDKFSQLHIHNPRVWWPYVMGEPHLETLSLRFVEGGHVSDEKTVQFGIREITSELTDKGYRLFRINGKPLLIRGGGWSQDMLLRQNPAHLRDEFRLVQDMRLNTIRLEGKLETDDFFSLADQKGILVLLGWCCCDQWEHWKEWTPENYTVAAASLRSQMLRLRYHPSLLVWLNGSDNPPPPDVENAYLKIEADTHWPNPTLSSASARPTEPSGRSGVKMSGPYDYVPPSYWYVDTRHGGAYGFNTETSPGPAIPNAASLRKFIPADQMWPPNATWSYHNGGGDFANLTVFDGAMKATYGAPASLDDLIRLSQTMSYDSERAMYEAYSRNKYTSTGVIQWMLNNAWPSMIWHLFDYYLDADGSYFGTKKACEPLHVQYSYDDHSVVVINSTYLPASHLVASAHAYDLHLKPVFSGENQVDAAPDSSNRVMAVPDAAFQSSPVTFVDLTLKDAAGAIVSRNFYWVPAKLTTFDWSKTEYTYTPAIQYANLQDLRSLPAATVEAHVRESAAREGRTIEVTLRNPSQALAFQVAAAARTDSDGLIAPVLWSDNYIELMPGESRTLTAVLPPNAPAQVAVHVSGWNFPEQTLHLGGEKKD
ncbi:MAG TPA: glycosyl hydrolase family 2 [Acidobacteriaceae bacterium]